MMLMLFFLASAIISMVTVSILTMIMIIMIIMGMTIMVGVRSVGRRGRSGHPLVSSRPCLLRVTPVDAGHSAAISLGVRLSSREIGSTVNMTDTVVEAKKGRRQRARPLR